MHTFCGEKTPTVSPSSLTATPISANTASLWTLISSVRFNFSSHVSLSSSIQKKKKNSNNDFGQMFKNWNTCIIYIYIYVILYLTQYF